MSRPLTLLERKRGFLSAISVENTQLLLLSGFALAMFFALSILGSDSQNLPDTMPQAVPTTSSESPDIVPEEAIKATRETD